MKGKFYAFSVLGIAALIAAGFVFKKEYFKPVYQAKDYTSFYSNIGVADAYGEFWYFMHQDGDGNVNAKDVLASRKNFRREASSKNPAGWLFWEYFGPDGVGGRMRGLIVDNQDESRSTLYAASVAGGLWISRDNAITWGQFNGDLDNPNLGDVGQTKNGILFVGGASSHERPISGLSNNNFPIASGGFSGGGLYRVTVDGNGSPSFKNLQAPNTPGSTAGWGIVNRIMGHPTEDNKLYVATGSGLQVTIEANADNPSWFNPVVVNGVPFAGLKVDDVAISNDGKTVYVTFNGSPSIYILKDNGGSDITVDKIVRLPDGPAAPRRTTLAVAPSDNNVVYAAVIRTDNSALHGVYQSRDAGETFQTIAKGGQTIPGGFDPYCQISGPGFCQGDYDAAIAVFPNDAGKVIIGGVSLWMWEESKTSPGTGGWFKIAHVQGSNNDIFDTNYVHADKHRIVFADSNLVYVASDGGVARSNDGGRTWSQNNNGLGITQPYTIDAAFGYTDTSGFSYENVMGGTQDNGTQVVGWNSTNPTRSAEIAGGDGFSCRFSSLGSVVFTSSYDGIINRGRAIGGRFFTNAGPFFNQELEDLGCPGDCGKFFTRFTYWETPNIGETIDSLKFKFTDTTFFDTIKAGERIFYTSNNIVGVPMSYESPKEMTYGDSVQLPDYAQSKFVFATGSPSGNGSTNLIYMTRDAANFNTIDFDWFLIASDESYPDKFEGNAWRMEFTRDGNQLYITTEQGDLYRIDNLNEGWNARTLDVRESECVLTCTKIYQSNSLTQPRITGLAVDPNVAGNLVITFGGFGGGNKVMRFTGADTTTGIISPINITGDLPNNIPVFTALIADHNSNTVVIGTEYGIYATDDAFSSVNPSWSYGWGAPKAAVYAMVQRTDSLLYDGDPYLPEVLDPHYRNVYAAYHGRGFYKTSSLTGLGDDDVEPTPKVVNRVEPIYFNVFPNPMSEEGYIDIELPENKNVTVEIYDLSGRLIDTPQNGVMPQGKSRLTIETSSFRSGTYIATLRSGEEVKVSKFVVMK